MHLNTDLTLELAAQRRSDLLRFAAETRMVRDGRTGHPSLQRIRSLRHLPAA